MWICTSRQTNLHIFCCRFPATGSVEIDQDDPSRVAEILTDFWRRNERVVVGVKKVGEL